MSGKVMSPSLGFSYFVLSYTLATPRVAYLDFSWPYPSVGDGNHDITGA